MKHVNEFGTIVKMSDRNYRLFIEAGARGERVSASDYGKVICVVDCTTTDWDEKDFEEQAAADRIIADAMTGR